MLSLLSTYSLSVNKIERRNVRPIDSCDTPLKIIWQMNGKGCELCEDHSLRLRWHTQGKYLLYLMDKMNCAAKGK